MLHALLSASPSAPSICLQRVLAGAEGRNTLTSQFGMDGCNLQALHSSASAGMLLWLCGWMHSCIPSAKCSISQQDHSADHPSNKNTNQIYNQWLMQPFSPSIKINESTMKSACNSGLAGMFGTVTSFTSMTSGLIAQTTRGQSIPVAGGRGRPEAGGRDRHSHR